MKRKLFVALALFFFAFSSYYSQEINSDSSRDMVLIPGGDFSMGIDYAQLPELVKMGKDVPHMSYNLALSFFGDEIPRHKVHVDSFFIDKYEVTNREYRKFVNATGYKSEGDWEKYAGEERDNHPVVNVTWNDAAAYAEWAGKRLPTEEEWEYAARGGTGETFFPWGNSIDSGKANYRYQGESFFAGVWRLLGFRKIGTKPVGRYAPNGFGLYDMIGNVREWTKSDYRLYEGAPAGINLKELTYIEEGKTMYKKVFRGGSWETSNPVFLRITCRYGIKPEMFDYDLGFRCVKSVNSRQ